MELKRARTSQSKSQYEIEYDENGEEIQRDEAEVENNEEMNNQQIAQGQTQQESSKLDLAMAQCDLEQKRVFIIDGKMTERHPLMFQVDHGSDKSKVMYDATADCFFQLQESCAESSMFLDRAIVRETRIFTTSQIDPAIFLIETLKKSAGKVFQSLDQILDIAMPEDDGIEEIRAILLKSARVKRSLKKICHVKILSALSGTQMTEDNQEDEAQITAYQFDKAKLMEHLKAKFILIRRHLAMKYIQTEGESIKRRNDQRQTSIVVQQQEKGQKSESVEMKTEQQLNILDPAKYEQLFDQKSAGFITDEIPDTLIDEFLEYLVSTNTVQKKVNPKITEINLQKPEAYEGLQENQAPNLDSMKPPAVRPMPTRASGKAGAGGKRTQGIDVRQQTLSFGAAKKK